MNPSQPEPVAGEQTPESAEVKACPFCQQVPKELGDGYVAHHLKDANCIIATYAFRLDRWNTRAESSSLASLQQENERLREELRSEIADKRTVEGFYKSAGDEAEQLRADVERLTKENEVQSHEIRLISDHRDQLMRERDEARAALEKINAIRNSIIAAQSVNFSEHVYPLVAALNETGLKGMDYPEALANFGTMLERTNKAEQERDLLRAQLAEREEDRKRLDHLENLIHHLPHTRFYWTDDPDEEMPVGFSITIEGCETSQIVGATLRECIDREMAYDEAEAIRSARGATPEGTPQEGAAGQAEMEEKL